MSNSQAHNSIANGSPVRLSSASKPLTFEFISQHPKVLALIDGANEVMAAMGYTEHGRRHVGEVQRMTGEILTGLKFSDREIELARIAAYLHDIGNVISRTYHPLTGANLAFTLLNEMGMDPQEIAPILGAIGNHEEISGTPVSAISAALIIADKSDVNFRRVQNPFVESYDIHDRVNSAVKRNELRVDSTHGSITLELEVDTGQATMMEYFEIFLNRMVMCRLSASRLGVRFGLVVNGTHLEGS
jgi:hypothetical protein